MLNKLVSLMILLLALTGVPYPVGAAQTEPVGTSIAPEKVRSVLEAYLKQKKDVLPKADVHFKTLQLPEAFTVPQGRVTYQVVPSDPRILESRSFSLIVRVDGNAVKNISVRGQLEALASVVVAAGDLMRGVPLSLFDLNTLEMDIIGLRNPCFDPQELVGKELKRSVRLGDPIDRRFVDFPPLIKRGDRVSIQIRKGAMLLTAVGEARQDGNEGETIKVRNESSRREILCTVVAPGVVEVEI